MNTIGEVKEELPQEEVIHLDQTYFPQPWTWEQWRTLDSNLHKLFTLRTEGIIIGFALFSVSAFDDTAHLYKILVVPEFRGSGYSHDFWSKLKAKLSQSGLKSIYLEVETLNIRAVRFYNKEGFQTLREVKGFYSNGESAYIMQLTL